MNSSLCRFTRRVVPPLVLLLTALACHVPSRPAIPTEQPDAAGPPAQVSPEPTGPPTAMPSPTRTPFPPEGEEQAGQASSEPPADPTPTTTSMPTQYVVAFVPEDSALSVLADPGADSEVIGTLPYDTGGHLTFITMERQAADGSLWSFIHVGSLNGWVHRYFLTEHVYPSQFCKDTLARAVVDALTTAVDAGDGAALAGLVHPMRGLLIRHNWWNPEVRLSADEVATFFTDPTVRDWGLQDGSGEPITGPAGDVIVPLLRRDLLAGDRQIACREILAGGSAGSITLPSEYQAVNFYAVHRPPPDRENVFDWGTWVIGIEYWDEEPWLCYLVHYEWEI
jgi:hypothetical protein